MNKLADFFKILCIILCIGIRIIILVFLLLSAYGVLLLISFIRKKYNFNLKLTDIQLKINHYIKIDADTKLISIEDEKNQYLVIIGKGYSNILNTQSK